MVWLELDPETSVLDPKFPEDLEDLLAKPKVNRIKIISNMPNEIQVECRNRERDIHGPDRQCSGHHRHDGGRKRTHEVRGSNQIRGDQEACDGHHVLSLETQLRER